MSSENEDYDNWRVQMKAVSHDFCPSECEDHDNWRRTEMAIANSYNHHQQPQSPKTPAGTKKYHADLVMDANYSKEYGLLDEHNQKAKISMWQEEIRTLAKDPGIVVAKVVADHDGSLKLNVVQLEYESLQILDQKTHLLDGTRFFLSLPLEIRIQLDLTESNDDKNKTVILQKEMSEKSEKAASASVLSSPAAKMISVDEFYSGKYDEYFPISYHSQDNLTDE